MTEEQGESIAERLKMLASMLEGHAYTKVPLPALECGILAKTLLQYAECIAAKETPAA